MQIKITMDFLFAIVGVLVAATSTYAHNSRVITSYRVSPNRNSYSINGLYEYDNRNVLMDRDCYDMCYDAHCRGTRTRVAGCMCSRFDFTGIEFGGGFNQRRYSTNCNCPSGTVCVRSNGRRRCVIRSSLNRPTYSRTSVRGNSYPINSGLPRTVGGHCGHLSSVCQASQRDMNQRVEFTYNYNLRRCVRVRVHSICTPLGPRNNIFASLRTCNRMCL